MAKICWYQTMINENIYSTFLFDSRCRARINLSQVILPSGYPHTSHLAIYQHISHIWGGRGEHGKAGIPQNSPLHAPHRLLTPDRPRVISCTKNPEMLECIYNVIADALCPVWDMQCPVWYMPKACITLDTACLTLDTGHQHCSNKIYPSPLKLN